MTVTKVTDRELWRAVHRAADDLQPDMRDAFIDAVEQLRRQVDLDTLTAAIEQTNAVAAAATATGALGEAGQAVADKIVDVLERTVQTAPVGFSMSFDQVNRQAVAWASRRSAQLVTAVTSETRQAIRDIVTQAVRSQLTDAGSDPRLQARMIRETVGLTQRDAQALARFTQSMQAEGMSRAFIRRQVAARSDRMLRRRALNIARTETLNAANKGVDLMWRQAADDGLIDRRRARRVWIVTPDDRLCERCMSLEGSTVGFDDAFTEAVETAPRNRPVTTQLPPLHPSCVVGDTHVATRGRVHAVSERPFKGDVVVLRTRENELTITPNHPVLTPRGWVAAGLLEPGDEVVRDLTRDWSDAVGNDGDVPPMVHEVADTFRVTPGVVARPVPGAAEDFHGDGEEGQVAVVRTDGELRYRVDATFREQVRQNAFALPDVDRVSHDRVCPRHQFSPRRTSPLAGLVGGRDLGAPFLGGHAGPLDRLSFGLAADVDFPVLQAASDDVPGHVVGAGEGVLGLTGFVASDDVVDRQVDPLRLPAASVGLGGVAAELDAPVGEAAVDRMPGDVETFRDVLDRLAGTVATDTIVSVDVVLHVGHVYNLETEDGLYAASGLMVHNCRCATGLEFDLGE